MGPFKILSGVWKMKLKFTSLSKTVTKLLATQMVTLCLTTSLLVSNIQLKDRLDKLERRPVSGLEFKSVRSIYTEMPELPQEDFVEESTITVDEPNVIAEEPTIIVDEPNVIVEEPVEEVVQEDMYTLPFSEDEIYLMAKVCLAEAEDQSEYGKRLVVSTMLNRLDSGIYGDSIYDVIYAPYQFEVMSNGRIDRVEPDEHTLNLVKEEVVARSNYDVIYFRMDYYSEYGTPLFVEDDHYFSGF